MSKKEIRRKKRPVPQKTQTSDREPAVVSPANPPPANQPPDETPISNRDPIPLDPDLLDDVAKLTVPAGWQDDGTTLTAPNGYKVIKGFRQYILTHVWDADNLPLEDEHPQNPLEENNPGLGGGSQQIFNWTTLEWDPQRNVRIMYTGIGEDVGKTIDLTDPVVAYYFSATSNSRQWHCNQTGHIVQFGILSFYRSFGQEAYCGLTHLGLPLSNEIPIEGHPGVVKQQFERAWVCYDPTHAIDHPPGAGDVYLMHLL